MVHRFLLFVILLNSTLFANPIIVCLPDTTSLPDTTINIPIRTSDVTGVDVYSFGTKISFNPQVLEFLSITNQNTLTFNWTEMAINDSSGLLRISSAGASALEGSGVLIYLTFNVIGQPEDSTLLEFLSFEFNDGSPEVITDNGSLTITNTSITTVAIRDTFAAPGSHVNVPIIISDVSKSEIYSVGIVLLFDQNILKVLDISTENTLTAAWGDVLYNNTIDASFISFAGAQPLTGGGILINMLFEVIGNSGDSTAIRFQHLEFNDGIPTAKTNDGEFFVVDPADVIPITKPPPNKFELLQNYPNPFNPYTTIKFQIPHQSHVDIKIYNALSHEIKTLVHRIFNSGIYSAHWDGADNYGENVSSGVYFIRLEAQTIGGVSHIQTRKMIIVR